MRGIVDGRSPDVRSLNKRDSLIGHHRMTKKKVEPITLARTKTQSKNHSKMKGLVMHLSVQPAQVEKANESVP